MFIHLVDDTLQVQVYYDPSDLEYDDNICLSIQECCPSEEKVLTADEVNLYLTPDQARQLAQALLEAVAASEIGDGGKGIVLRPE